MPVNSSHWFFCDELTAFWSLADEYVLQGYQSTRTLYELVPSQFVPKSTAGPSQLKYSRTAVPTWNLFKNNNRNAETLIQVRYRKVPLSQ